MLLCASKFATTEIYISSVIRYGVYIYIYIKLLRARARYYAQYRARATNKKESSKFLNMVLKYFTENLYSYPLSCHDPSSCQGRCWAKRLEGPKVRVQDI